MTITAQLKWTDGMQFVARSGKGPGVLLDSTDSGSGMSPMQMVLAGVAGCTAIDVILIMQKKRATVTRFLVNITGEQASENPKRFTRIHVEYILRGSGIKARAVEQAIELSETKYCSALASLNAEFDHRYQIENDH